MVCYKGNCRVAELERGINTCRLGCETFAAHDPTMLGVMLITFVVIHGPWRSGGAIVQQLKGGGQGGEVTVSAQPLYRGAAGLPKTALLNCAPCTASTSRSCAFFEMLKVRYL